MKVAICLVLTLSCAAVAAASNDAIDFEAFLRDANEAQRHREARLVEIDDFNAMAAQEDTLILDTRSRAAYELRHLRGAVHLNFSELTEETLARVVGPRNRRVLIYCNNNFLDDPVAFATKTSVGRELSGPGRDALAIGFACGGITRRLTPVSMAG